MPRTKSTKFCPRCERELPITDFEKRPLSNGRDVGYYPRCRACTRPHGKSLFHERIRESIPEPNPSGLCMCGCGSPTPLAKQSHRGDGNVKGKPIRYIAGHQSFKDAYTPDHYTVDQKTECWVWNGFKGANGYGTACENGKSELAHRLYYKKFVGAIPAGTEIDHLCRNRACCNPDHLEAVPRVVNLRRGAGTKLTPDQVRTIRRLWDTGNYTRPQLGKMFGVASTTVQMVVYRRSWKDVD